MRRGDARGMQRARAGVLAGLFLVLVASHGADAQKKKKGAAEPPPTAGKPPPGKPMSLADVLQHAVQQSPALASARIDVEVAEARVLEATGIEDWVLGLNGSVNRTRKEPAEGATFTTNKSEDSEAEAYM